MLAARERIMKDQVDLDLISLCIVLKHCVQSNTVKGMLQKIEIKKLLSICSDTKDDDYFSKHIRNVSMWKKYMYRR